MLGRVSAASIAVFVVSFCVLALLVSSQQQLSDNLSFQPPYGIPNWSIGGDAMIFEDFVRLAEDRQSKTGYLWSDNANQLESWEATFKFTINGKGRLGADGLAFWYTEGKEQEGNLFGNDPHYKGLGILIDTYDNDKSGKHPYLALEFSDGNTEYSHDHSAKQADGTKKQGCQVPVRNLQEPTTVVVSYSNSVIQVSIDIGSRGDVKQCGTLYRQLPRGYFFGFTAATGHLADNHDLHSFELKSLDPSVTFVKNQGVQVQPKVQSKWRDLGSAADIQPAMKYQQDILNHILAVKSTLEKLSIDLGAIPKGQDQASQGRASQECGRLITQVSAVQSSLDTSNSALGKRYQEIKSALNEIQTQLRDRPNKPTYQPPTPPPSGFDLAGWLTVLLVLILIIVNVFFLVKFNGDRNKRYL